MKVIAAALVGAASLLAPCMNANAQEPALPPILRDIPETATLPKDGVFDILGIRLGMPKDDVVARLEELSKGKVAPERAVNLLHDNRLNQFRFIYDWQVMVAIPQEDGSNETIYVYFTTRVNGERAMLINRRISYATGRAGSIPGLVADLNTKYGAPSYLKAGPVTEIYYAWHNGRRLNLSDRDVQARQFAAATPERCIHAETPYYNFDGQRRDNFPGCTTRMLVRIGRGQRDDLASNVEFILSDYARYMQNARDTDAWLIKEMQRVTGAQTGTRPKL
jgi:hypothetical protein